MLKKLFFCSTIGLSMMFLFPVEKVTAGRMELDFDQQCQQQYGNNSQAELIGNSVLDWKCETKKTLPIYRQLDVNAACQNQYRFSHTKYSDFNDPDSWFCQINEDRLEVDLNKQCKKQYGGKYQAELIGSTVLDWKCQTEEKRIIYERVNINDACQNQYGVSTTPKYSYFYAPDSWFCEV